MPVLSLNAEIRGEEELGSGPSGRLRRNGGIPAVIYGLSRDPVNVKIGEKEFADLIRGVEGTIILKLALGGVSEPAMIQSVQRHPVTRRPYCIDFLRIDMSKPIHVSVRVRVTATPTDLAAIERFAHITKHVEVECLPADIPSVIEVDASAVTTDTPLRAADLAMGERITLLTPGDTVIGRIEAIAPPEAEEVPEEPAPPPSETPPPAEK
jgi:large subunit ribosomal protein L25